MSTEKARRKKLAADARAKTEVDPTAIVVRSQMHASPKLCEYTATFTLVRDIVVVAHVQQRYLVDVVKRTLDALKFGVVTSPAAVHCCLDDMFADEDIPLRASVAFDTDQDMRQCVTQLRGVVQVKHIDPVRYSEPQMRAMLLLRDRRYDGLAKSSWFLGTLCSAFTDVISGPYDHAGMTAKLYGECAARLASPYISSSDAEHIAELRAAWDELQS